MTLATFLDRTKMWKTRISVNLNGLASQHDIDQVSVVMRDTTEIDEIREFAAASLGRISSDYTIRQLEQGIKQQSDHKLQLFCVQGLSISQHKRCDAILLARLCDHNEDGRIRSSACYALANRKVEAVIPYAIQYIDEPFMSENTFISSNLAIESLLKFKTTDTLDAIIEWSMMTLADASRTAGQRERAANYLMRFGDDRCDHLMIDMINDDVVYAKRLAAGKSGNNAVEYLKRLDTAAAQEAIQAWLARR